jgi:hypothetical protein
MDALIIVPMYMMSGLWMVYPFFMITQEIQNNDDGVTAANRSKALELVMLEHYLLEATNAMRAQVGKLPLEHQSVLQGFKDFKWEVVKTEVRQLVLGSIRKIAWIKEVVS